MPGSLERFVIEKWPRTRLKAAEYNPRQISERERDKLIAVIKSHGMVEPIVVNRRTGNIVGGHQRVSILDDLYATDQYELTVSVIDVGGVREKEINIALNNSEAGGSFELDKLNALLSTPDLSLVACGLAAANVYRLFGDAAKIEDSAAEKYAEDVRNALTAKASATGSPTTSPNFYIVLVFSDANDMRAFSERHGLDANRYQNGDTFEAALAKH